MRFCCVVALSVGPSMSGIHFNTAESGHALEIMLWDEANSLREKIIK